MVLWFIATSVATVWFVFRDPRFDYRLLIVGSLLPDAVDAGFGGAWALHSVVVVMAALVAVMLATIGRRPLRRALLAVPIGMLLHLVFDGAFADTDTFWWPFSGSLGHAALPVVARGWWNAALEVAAAVVIGLAVPRFRLLEAPSRRRFLATGQLTAPGREF